eukprot:1738841-Rhodomonas_salina.3
MHCDMPAHRCAALAPIGDTGRSRPRPPVAPPSVENRLPVEGCAARPTTVSIQRCRLCSYQHPRQTNARGQWASLCPVESWTRRTVMCRPHVARWMDSEQPRI